MLLNTIKIILFCTFLVSNVFAQIKPILELKVHDDVIDTIVVENGILYTGSYDGYVKQTDLNTYKTHKIAQQNDWIRSLLLVDGELIVAGNEGTILGFDLQNNNQAWKIDAHKNWITGLAYKNGKLISVSMDEHVKVWDIKTKKKLYEKKIYGTHKHQCICIEKNSVYIGSTSSISMLLLAEDYNVTTAFDLGETVMGLSCTTDSSDTFFGLSTGKILKVGNANIKKKIHEEAVKALVQRGEYIFSGSDDGKIMRSNADSLENETLLYSGSRGVSVLHEDAGFLYAGFADGTIKIFDLRGEI